MISEYLLFLTIKKTYSIVNNNDDLFFCLDTKEPKSQGCGKFS
jgi:hypothetical protein